MVRSVISLFVLFTFVGCVAPSPQPTAVLLQKPSPILVIGHRGACGSRPEHTTASYELAIEQGADYIECDLVSTKDHVLYIRHENEIGQTTDAASRFPERRTTKTVDGQRVTGWFIEDFTASEVRLLKARERLPGRDHSYDDRFPLVSFDDFLDLASRESTARHRTIGVYVETKHPTYFDRLGLPLETEVARALQRHGLSRPDAPVFLESFELESLAKLKKLTPVPLVFLIDEPALHPADFIASGDPRTYGDLLTPKNLREIRKIADGIGPSKDEIVPEGNDRRLAPATSLVSDAHAAGLKVHPYTFRSDAPFLNPAYAGDPAREYRKFFELGVDGVFSDFPADAVGARTVFVNSQTPTKDPQR